MGKPIDALEETSLSLFVIKISCFSYIALEVCKDFVYFE